MLINRDLLHTRQKEEKKKKEKKGEEEKEGKKEGKKGGEKKRKKEKEKRKRERERERERESVFEHRHEDIVERKDKSPLCVSQWACYTLSFAARQLDHTPSYLGRGSLYQKKEDEEEDELLRR